MKNCRHTILLILSSVSVILLRNNGKYVIYPMVFVAILLMKRRGILKSRENIVRAASRLSVIILMPILISYLLTEAYDIEKGSIKEMLSLPFQQTARYIVTYGDEVTDEERQAIDQILDYDSLAELYNPMISDYIKNTFREDSTQRELIDYFKVWLSQFVKHPMTYMIATVNQNYKLLYPAEIDYPIWLILETYDSRFGEFIEALGVKEINQIKMREENLRNFYITMLHIPMTGLFSVVAVYNLVLFYILVYSAYKRMYSVWIVAAPLVISDLIIVAGPLVQPRYAFPVIYSIPVVMAAFLYANRKKL